MNPLPPPGPTVWLVDPGAHVPEYVRSLAAGLAGWGCDVRIRDWPGPARRPDGRRRRWLSLAGAAAGHGSPMTRLVLDARRQRPDVVHLQWSVLPPVDAGAMRAVSRAGSRTLLTVHDVLPHERRPWQALLRRGLYRSVDGLIVHSHATAHRLAAMGIDAARASVVPMSAERPIGPGAPPDRLRARQSLQLGLPADSRLVLFFGQVRPYKGLDLLLAALARCRRVDSRIHLLVAGEMTVAPAPAASQGLLRRVAPEHVGDGVIWRGGVRPATEVPLLFAACDVVALPYRDTDDSAVLPEALANGRAVVASSVGGLPEALARGGGLLVPPGDVSALAEALLCVLADDTLRARLEAEARAAAEAWTWRDAARATCLAYARLLGLQAGGTGRPDEMGDHGR